MKVISKRKDLNGICSLVRFKCPVCESKLEESKEDLTPVMLFDKLHFSFVCPVCEGQVAVPESELESVRGVSFAKE